MALIEIKEVFNYQMVAGIWPENNWTWCNKLNKTALKNNLDILKEYADGVELGAVLAFILMSVFKLASILRPCSCLFFNFAKFMTNRNWKEQMVVLFIGGSFKKRKKEA